MLGDTFSVFADAVDEVIWCSGFSTVECKLNSFQDDYFAAKARVQGRPWGRLW